MVAPFRLLFLQIQALMMQVLHHQWFDRIAGLGRYLIFEISFWKMIGFLKSFSLFLNQINNYPFLAGNILLLVTSLRRA